MGESSLRPRSQNDQHITVYKKMKSCLDLYEIPIGSHEFHLLGNLRRRVLVPVAFVFRISESVRMFIFFSFLLFFFYKTIESLLSELILLFRYLLASEVRTVLSAHVV